MKATPFVSLLLILAVLVFPSGCDTKTTKNEECDNTKMKLEEPVIHLKVYLVDYPLPGQKKLFNAERLVVSGSITKIYCSGDVSGSFQFNPSFFPDEFGSFAYFGAGYYLPQPYQFKFENTLDYLQLIIRVTAYFPDGKIYESLECVKKYYFKDIKFDTDILYKYIGSAFPPQLEFYEVTTGPF